MWLTNATLLLPAAASVYLYGSGVIYRLLIACAVALLVEYLISRQRGDKPPSIADGSALTTGLIIGLTVPPLSPWFIPLTAALLAILIGKLAFGGLGNNPFNPAMLGYCLCFLAFPAHFQHWVGWEGSSGWSTLAIADGSSSPTPLLAKRVGEAPPNLFFEIFAIASAVGGGTLIALKIADWRLPLGFLVGALAIFAVHDEWESLLYGGMVFAMFFVVTDPVTAAVTPRGRLLYSFIVGSLAALLRLNGHHTDGIAFAVLAGNLLATLCDYLAQQLQNFTQLGNRR